MQLASTQVEISPRRGNLLLHTDQFLILHSTLLKSRQGSTKYLIDLIKILELEISIKLHRK